MDRDFSSQLLQQFVFSVVDGFELLPVIYWQSNGKAKKISCIFLPLEMLRESAILVAFAFNFAGLILTAQPCL